MHCVEQVIVRFEAPNCVGEQCHITDRAWNAGSEAFAYRSKPEGVLFMCHEHGKCSQKP